MEFFKGIELLDIMIAAAGVTLTLFMLLSNLPLRWMAALIVFIVFSASIIPLYDDFIRKSGLSHIVNALQDGVNHIDLTSYLIKMLRGHAYNQVIPQRPGALQ